MHTAQHHHVDATLNYLQYEGARPVIYAPRAADGTQPQSSVKPLATRVRIRDARHEAFAPTLDRSGFELLRHSSAVRDFADETRIRELYYPETAALLQRATGADHVVVFDHACRLDTQDKTAKVIPPVRQVHCDQTFVSGPRRVREHLPPAEADRRLQGRSAIINVWRPIGAPVQTAPLALCDARSIAPDDIIPTDFIYPDKTGEVALFRPNQAHRWYYYPHMTPDEVVLIKIYDSLEDGTARLSAHTAFDHPNTPIGAPGRRSIEVRALVFWPQ